MSNKRWFWSLLALLTDCSLNNYKLAYGPVVWLTCLPFIFDRSLLGPGKLEYYSYGVRANFRWLTVLDEIAGEVGC